MPRRGSSKPPAEPVVKPYGCDLHMFPYFWEKDKEHGEDTRTKYKRLWGEWLYENVMELHKADKMAH